MLFAFIRQDRPGAPEARLAARPRHLDHLERDTSTLVTTDPMLDGEGGPRGSSPKVGAADEAAARAVPGVFAQVEVRPSRMAFEDGARTA